MEEKVTIELNAKDARHLLNCIIRTGASGEDLDVGEEVEEILWNFVKDKEKR
jgi:hypothetical protein